MNEINKLDKEAEEMNNDLQKCINSQEMVGLGLRKDYTKINELNLELQDTYNRVFQAKAAKQMEIEKIQQELEGSILATENLKCQLSEAEERLSEQIKVIEDLKLQVSNAEYNTKRKTSNFSIN
jgi:chromosome segregation ATPase